MKTRKSPITIPSIGGKTRLIRKLVPILQETAAIYNLNSFVDIFGGGNKFIPYLYEMIDELIYNDFDTGLSKLMLCATDIDYLQAVIDKAYEYQFEIQMKADFDEAKILRNDDKTPIIEAAALTLVVIKLSRAADRRSFLKSKINEEISYPSLLKYLDMNTYMRNVHITNTDYKNLIFEIKYQSDFLIYLDPPYYKTKSYDGEVDHKELAESIVDAKAKVIISNFDNPIYQEKLEDRGWYKYFLGRINKPSAAKRGSTQEEFIWTNFEIPDYLLSHLNITRVT